MMNKMCTSKKENCQRQSKTVKTALKTPQKKKKKEMTTSQKVRQRWKEIIWWMSYMRLRTTMRQRRRKKRHRVGYSMMNCEGYKGHKSLFIINLL